MKITFLASGWRHVQPKYDISRLVSKCSQQERCRERAREEKKKKERKTFLKASIFFTRCFLTTATATPPPTLRRAARHRTAVEVVFERLKLFCFRFPIVSSSLFYCAEN